jgi:hypothetical protein
MTQVRGGSGDPPRDGALWCYEAAEMYAMRSS